MVTGKVCWVTVPEERSDPSIVLTRSGEFLHMVGTAYALAKFKSIILPEAPKMTRASR